MTGAKEPPTTRCLKPLRRPLPEAEGNYLLLDEEPWVHLADMFDLTVMLKADPGELRRRLVDRWLAHGLDPDQALARALSNDIPNAELVVRDSRKADLEIAG
jgi:pantothenate kinase